MKHIHVLSLLVVFTTCVSSAQTSVLEQKIPRYELASGVEGIGGATMLDAVNELRSVAGISICFEEIQYDAPNLTLATAINRLTQVKKEGPLSRNDQLRWRRYQELAREQDPDKLVIGIDKKTFKMPEQKNVPLRTLLDELVKTNPEYKWSLAGDESAAIVVIEPATGSVLNWKVEIPCRDYNLQDLYSAHGQFIPQLAARSINVVWFGERATMPNGSIELCKAEITAREVLNRTVALLHTPGFHWTLTGLKNLRWLSFE